MIGAPPLLYVRAPPLLDGQGDTLERGYFLWHDSVKGSVKQERTVYRVSGRSDVEHLGSRARRLDRLLEVRSQLQRRRENPWERYGGTYSKNC